MSYSILQCHLVAVALQVQKQHRRKNGRVFNNAMTRRIRESAHTVS